MKHEILIVDDERDIRQMLGELLEDEGYSCRLASNADEAQLILQEYPPALVILDIWMEGSSMDGLELQKWIRNLYPTVPVIMISGHGNIETAVQAMKDGAYDFVEKPFKSDRLLLLVERALQRAAMETENIELRKKSDLKLDIIGASPQIIHLRQSIDKIAPSNSRVLISGAAGCGKELVARNIHAGSDRSNGRFVLANCALLSPESLTAELFGTEGIDGRERIVGLFEQAHGGTLYFDEVCDLPLETQGKLVRAIQDQRFRRVGGAVHVSVDVRVISASSRDLLADIEAGNFREDLYYRLSVVPLDLPPLSAHKDDIPALAEYFLHQSKSGRSMGFSDSALALMQIYDWPGNVMQLRNVIDWLLIMVDKSVIDACDLPPEVSGRAPRSVSDVMDGIVGLPLKAARERFERQYLHSQLSRFGGNVSRTAAFVGMERAALHRKLKALGLHADKDGILEVEA